ncbi:MAG: glycosyltransferase family 1 protein [Caldilineaceae bacterium]|nr:glycosyltransferase family 1 protein [Caldilineaceae bacterium]
MRILALSAQLPGHLDWGGYLNTAAELVRRGHNVLWASGAAVAERVGRAQVPFHTLAETGWRWPPPPPLILDANADPQTVQQQRQIRALDQWLDVDRVSAATHELLALVTEYRPDLILSEMFIAAAGLVAEQASTPLVVMGWPATMPQTVTGADSMAALARTRLNELLARSHLNGVNWTSDGPPALCSPLAHLTYWSPTWFAGMAMAPQTRHFGGLRPLLPRDAADAASLAPDLPSPDDAPWVLITLGTSFNADPNFFIAAAHAADQLGCLPLLALGAPLETSWVQTMQPRLPSSAHLAAHLDFGAFLPHVAAAIHHGGAGTTHALVTHAVPQIVVPHAGEQMRQAQGVVRSGVGYYLPPKEVTLPLLVETLAQALPDRSGLRTQAAALQAEFHALGGVPAAADQLEALQ